VRFRPSPYDSAVSSRSASSPLPASGAFDPARLADACRRWKIAELDVFGSVARGEAGPRSDLDLLVTFLPDADWGLLDHAAIEEDLTGIFGRRVDLVTRRAVERSSNALRKREILASARPIYVS
jgi:predicted nucleotidyltransferase